MISTKDIEFPIYRLGECEKVERGGGITAVETIRGRFIVDDTNLPGGLAQRRLALAKYVEMNERDVNLFPLKYRYEDLAEVHRDRKINRKTRFIDNSGKVFFLNSRNFVPIKYRRVLKQKIVEGKYTLLYLEGERMPAKVKRPIRDLEGLYCGVLYGPNGRELIDFTYTPSNNRRKKV